MIEPVKRCALLIALILAMASPAYAKSFVIIVPPGTVSATTVVYSQNSSGAVTSTNTTSFCPAANTITITLPSDTSSTSWSGEAVFSNSSGNVTGMAMVTNDDTGGGGATKN